MEAFLVYRHPLTKEICYAGTDEGRTFVDNNYYVVTRFDAYLGAGKLFLLLLLVFVLFCFCFVLFFVFFSTILQKR